EPEPEPASQTSTGESTADTSGSEGKGKPYLATLPEGFATELIVVEWLEFLVEEAGVRGTAQAIDYYETIDWIDEEVGDDLQEYLSGFDSGGTATLTIDHHTQSLKYIGQLNGDGGAVAASRLQTGGGLDGIQR
ncbi:MAG: FlaD/FlaE family flagellar protein, partial [Haloarculaceae archaeon]